MKDKPKLGRGLDDVSQHFLSRPSQREMQPEAPAVLTPVRAITVCHPGDPLLQACLVANFALELAKRRYPVKVHDYSVTARVRTFLRAILREEDCGPDLAVVRLYGLPEIEIREAGEARLDQTPPVRETPAWEGLRGRYQLVNAAGPLDFFREGGTSPEQILIAKAEEKALLQAYAYCKVMRGAGAQQINLILLDTSGMQDTTAVFRAFAGFVEQRLGCAPSLLGALTPDEPLERSLTDGRPLVLSRGHSPAAAAIGEMCQRLLERAEGPGVRSMEGL